MSEYFPTFDKATTLRRAGGGRPGESSGESWSPAFLKFFWQGLRDALGRGEG